MMTKSNSLQGWLRRVQLENAHWISHPIFKSPYLYHGMLFLAVCVGTVVYYSGPPEALFDTFHVDFEVYASTFNSKEFTALIVAVTALSATAFTYFIQFSAQIVSRWNKIQPFFSRYSERFYHGYAQLDILTFWGAIAIFYIAVISITIVTFSCISEEHPMETCSEWYNFDYILKIVAMIGAGQSQIMRIYLCPDFYGDVIYPFAFTIRTTFFLWWTLIGLREGVTLMALVCLNEIRYNVKWFYLSENTKSRNRKKQRMKEKIEMVLSRQKEKEEVIIAGEEVDAGAAGGKPKEGVAATTRPSALDKIDEEVPVSSEFSVDNEAKVDESKTGDSASGLEMDDNDSDEGKLDHYIAEDSSSITFVFSLLWTLISGDHYGTASIRLYSDGFLTAQNEALCRLFDVISFFFSFGRIIYLGLVYNETLIVYQANNVRIRVAVCLFVLLGVKWVSQFVIERILVRLERSVREMEEENHSMRVSLDMLLPPGVIDNLIHSINKESRQRRKNLLVESNKQIDPIVTSEFIVYRIPAGEDNETALIDAPINHGASGSSGGISANSESSAMYTSDSNDESERSEESWFKYVNSSMAGTT